MVIGSAMVFLFSLTDPVAHRWINSFHSVLHTLIRQFYIFVNAVLSLTHCLRKEFIIPIAHAESYASASAETQSRVAWNAAIRELSWSFSDVPDARRYLEETKKEALDMQEEIHSRRNWRALGAHTPRFCKKCPFTFRKCPWIQWKRPIHVLPTALKRLKLKQSQKTT